MIETNPYSCPQTPRCGYPSTMFCCAEASRKVEMFASSHDKLITIRLIMGATAKELLKMCSDCGFGKSRPPLKAREVKDTLITEALAGRLKI